MKAATPPSLVVLRTTAAGRAASSVTSKLSSKPQAAQADADSAFTPSSSLPHSFPPPPSKKSARSPNNKQFKVKPTISPNKCEWAIWKDTNASQLLASSPSSRAAGSEVAPATLSSTSTSSRSLKHAFSKIKQDSVTKAVDSSACTIHVKAVTAKAAAVLPEHPSLTTSNPGRPPLDFPPPALAVRRNIKIKTAKKRAALAPHRTSTPLTGVAGAAAQSIVPPIQDVGPDAWTRARETLQQVASLDFGAALQQRQQAQTPSSSLVGQQQDVAREMSRLIDTLAGLRDALSGQPSLASEARVEPTAAAFEASTVQQTPAEGVKKAKKMAKALKQAEEKTTSTSPPWREPLPSLSPPTTSSSASTAPSPPPPATRDSTTGAWITSPHPPPGVTPPPEHLLTCPIAYWIGSAPYPPWSILLDRSRVLNKKDLARAALPFERLAVRPLSMAPPPLTPAAAGPWESGVSAMAITQARLMDLSREYEIEIEALMTMARHWQKARLTREKHVAAAAAPEVAVVSEPVVEEIPVVVAEAAEAPAVTPETGPDVEVKTIEMDPVIQAQPESLVATPPPPPPSVEEVAIVSPVVIKVEEPTVLVQEAVAIAPTPALEPQAGEQGPIGGVSTTLEMSTDVAQEVPVSTSPVEAVEGVAPVGAVVDSSVEEVVAAVSATLPAPSLSTAPEQPPSTSSVGTAPVAAPIKLRRSQRQKSPFTSSALGARPRSIPSGIPPPDEAPTTPKRTTYTISSSIPQEYESESRRTLASWGFDTGGVPSIETLVNRRRGVSSFKRSSVSSEDADLGWPSSASGFGVLQSGNGSGPGGSGATKGWGSVWSSLFRGRGMHDH